MAQEFRQPGTGLDAARAPIIQAMSLAFVILGLPALILSVVASTRAGLHLLTSTTIAGYILLLAAKFAPSVGDRARALAMTAVTHLIGAYLLLELGPGGPGPMWLIAATVIAAVLLGGRGVVSALAAQLVTLSGATLILVRNPDPEYAFTLDLPGWLAVATASLLLAGALALGVSKLVTSLGQQIDRLHEETERRAALEAQLERRVAERTAELVTSNADLERFAHAASHDLRSLLQASAASAELLHYTSPALPPAHEALVDRIESGVARAAATIESLLGLAQSRAIALERTRVNLSRLSFGVLNDFGIADPSRRLQPSIQPNVMAEADEDLVRLILQNLFSNALKFSPSDRVARVEFGVATVQGERAYFVRDHGVGLEPGGEERLFQDFVRLPGHPEIPGIGLGLATVARLVRRHAGRVWAEGAPNEGATFWFTLGETSAT